METKVFQKSTLDLSYIILDLFLSHAILSMLKVTKTLNYDILIKYNFTA